MSASTDANQQAAAGRPPTVLAAAWRPAGLLYLAACLAGLLAGLYPEAIYPSRKDVLPAPLPTLQALAAAQVLFILVVHPLIAMRRGLGPSTRRYWAETVVESLTWLVVTVPLYAAAAWLADATPADVLRTVVYLLGLWPVAWSAGALLRREGAARPAVLLLLLVAASLPAAYYITREFLAVFPADWLWDLAPVTAVWEVAASRAGNLLPRPLWALVVWPAAAVALAAVGTIRRSPALDAAGWRPRGPFAKRGTATTPVRRRWRCRCRTAPHTTD